MGVDLGTRRIGLALTDELLVAAHPLTTLVRRGNRQDSGEIAELVARHEVGRVVVGTPYGLDGRAGPAGRT